MVGLVHKEKKLDFVQGVLGFQGFRTSGICRQDFQNLIFRGTKFLIGKMSYPLKEIISTFCFFCGNFLEGERIYPCRLDKSNIQQSILLRQKEQKTLIYLSMVRMWVNIKYHSSNRGLRFWDMPQRMYKRAHIQYAEFSYMNTSH